MCFGLGTLNDPQRREQPGRVSASVYDEVKPQRSPQPQPQPQPTSVLQVEIVKQRRETLSAPDSSRYWGVSAVGSRDILEQKVCI